ncbi:hypothetical protein TWF694_007171 [Orbilia ellipsospora]|uniref:Acyl-CoA thioesterase II n=1 Tax=Orbilia ellipsospora TaxID=2528407 RepID=A0AAV9XKC7_9PEZI
MQPQKETKPVESPILKQIAIRTLEKDPYASVSIVENHYLPSRSLSIFGGQVIGQAILAAHTTIENGLSIHSFHGKFIDRTDPSQPVVYKVSPLRTGNTVANYLVHAFQYTRLVFIATVSFHRFEKSPVLKYNQALATNFPDMSETVSVKRSDYYHAIFNDNMKENDEVLLAAMEVRHMLPNMKRVAADIGKLKRFFEEPSTVPIGGIGKGSRAIKESFRSGCLANLTIWTSIIDSKTIHQFMRVKGQLPTHPKYNAAAFGMASDAFSSQLPAVLVPHQDLAWMTSLDHVIYFHKPFDPTKWLAVQNKVAVADGGRSVIEMKYWDKSGDLVATVLQEGLFRGKSKSKL